MPLVPQIVEFVMFRRLVSSMTITVVVVQVVLASCAHREPVLPQSMTCCYQSDGETLSVGSAGVPSKSDSDTSRERCDGIENNLLIDIRLDDAEEMLAWWSSIEASPTCSILHLRNIVPLDRYVGSVLDPPITRCEMRDWLHV